MLKALATLFSSPPWQEEAHQLYVNIVEASRAPVFYAEQGVPDTVDGRFDMIALHMYLLSDRLKKENTQDALELLRATSEVFFADMDRSLREMGSTDTGVGKRIKKMSQAFYGRLVAYQTADDDAAQLQEALLRNLYRGDLTKLSQAMAMADYVQQQRQRLAQRSWDDIVQLRLF